MKRKRKRRVEEEGEYWYGKENGVGMEWNGMEWTG